jgi:biotin carboxylase
MSEPVTILCLASYEKGATFMRACKELGCRVLLITLEKLKDIDWPREAIDELFLMPDLYDRTAVANAVSYLARSERITRIVPLDEFDLEMASYLREHLRVPGMGETTVRYFRDKLAMRMKARECGIAVPDFTAVLNYDDLRHFMAHVPAPWMLKPRSQASTIGIRKLYEADQLWRALDTLGDQQSHHLLERFIPGTVYHADSVVAERIARFTEVSQYAAPPLDVYHGGGMFCSRTVERHSEAATTMRAETQRLVDALGMVRGVLHTEFIEAAEDGTFFFLETAARVGGANIVEMVNAATGVDLWREWARVELADARGEFYEPPTPRTDHAGIIVSLARQETPDTSAYDAPEIVWRMNRKQHVGLIVASPDARRVRELCDEYMSRFYHDFHAVLPPSDSATA